MLDRANSIVFIAADNDACALWRLYMPHVALPGSSFFHFRQRPDFEKIAGHDICVVQRCCTTAQFELIKACKQLGMKVVYDLDDNVWEIPKENPAHAPLFHYREGFKVCIRLVDVVSVSTKRLAKEVKKHVKDMTSAVTTKEIPVIVAPNRIEERLFAMPVFPAKPVVVGWAGSSSHIGDVRLMESAILECAKDYPKVVFEYRGCHIEESNPVRQMANWRHQTWMPVAEYAARMPLWGWSIAMAPVTDHPFNSSKSAIKMIEAGYCGIPCLASYVEPYAEFCSRDPELKWLLCAGPSAFRTKLRVLIEEPDRRDALGAAMARVVAACYSYRTRHKEWDEVFSAARAL